MRMLYLRRFGRSVPHVLVLVGTMWAMPLHRCFGQQYDPLKVIPASPTAAALGNYGNYDVSLHTGSANIAVPLYQHSTNDHIVNLSLQYDASGIRAAQEATWVGLGWSLLAGGVVTRTIRGIDDFNSNGYYYAPPVPTAITAESRPYFEEIASNRLDGEADLFNFNFQGVSGKFILAKKQPGGTVVYMDKQNNLRVECNDGVSWIITDPRGYRHYFGTKEYTRDDYSYAESIPLDVNAPLAWYTYNPTSPPATTWHLDSIVSPDGESVKFVYEQKSSSFPLPQFGERSYSLYYMEGYCSAASPRLPGGTSVRYTASRQVILDQYLKEIVFKDGKIHFRTTDRDDIDYIDTRKPQKLSEITVVGKDGVPVKRFLLDYGYFTDSHRGRLRLDHVLELSGDGSAAKPPYDFEYYSNTLPDKFTKAVDHWGYYNAQTENTTLLPYKYIEMAGRLPVYIPGAIRTADTTAVNYKAGVLTSIGYPTGGKTVFDYSQHEYTNLTEDDAYDVRSKRINIFARPENQYQYATDTFTLKHATNISLQFGYEKYIEGANDWFNIEVVFVDIIRDGVSYDYYSNWNCPTDPDPTCGRQDFTVNTVLPPGHYTLQVRYMEGWHTYVHAHWLERIPVTTRKGGGLRIKSITNFDDDGKEADYKRYVYHTTTGPTGKLLHQVVYYYTAVVNDYPASGTCNAYQGYYLLRHSSNMNALGLVTPGAGVGYDVVTEIRGRHGEGGSTVYTYRNLPAPVPGKPFVPAYASPLNGNANHVAVKNQAGGDLRIQEADHITLQTSEISSVKVYTEAIGELSTDFDVIFYKDQSAWVALRYDINTQVEGTKRLRTYRRYYYDNAVHKQPTRIHEQRNGEVFRIKRKFPGDYDAVEGSFTRELVKQNRVETVVEEQQLVSRDGTAKLVAAAYTEFAQFNGKFYKPSRMFNLSVSSADTAMTVLSGTTMVVPPVYREELQFLAYTPQGQVASWKKFGDTPVSYLWDFGGRHPVAEVRHAALDQVAYCSFEADGKGGWAFSGAIDATAAQIPAGKKCYNLTPATALSKGGLTNNAVYHVAYWSNNGPYSITGATGQGAVSVGEAVGGWRYYAHKVRTTAATVSISGTGRIDGVQLYPAGAALTTYLFAPLTGMTERADANGEALRFEYDGLQRLRFVKDTQGHVLKRYYYHYAKSPLLN